MKSDLKKRAVDYLGGCCLLCGFDECLASLDFHHINPTDKSRNISEFSTWSEEMMEELDKCVLLCSNHHRIVHNTYFDCEIFTILEI